MSGALFPWMFDQLHELTKQASILPTEEVDEIFAKKRAEFFKPIKGVVVPGFPSNK